MTSRDRHVVFETCFNFRDLGGYDTIDGARVRTGAVFRADTLHRLTAADLDTAQQLGLRTIIDLRTTVEIEKTGRFPELADVTFHHVPVFEETNRPFTTSLDEPEPPPGDTYLAMARAGKDAIAEAIRKIASGELAVVFHCVAGKDRTGILAALVLSTLGVPDATVIADYHLSEQALAPFTAWAEANDPATAAELAALPAWILRSPPPTMEAFLHLVRDQYGSTDGYLRDAGVDDDVLDELRGRLLEQG